MKSSSKRALLQERINEIKQLVHEKFPDAEFRVGKGPEPGTYLYATVDVADTDEVRNVVLERIVDIQVDEGLDLYFLPLRPPEKVLADFDRKKAERANRGAA